MDVVVVVVVQLVIFACMYFSRKCIFSNWMLGSVFNDCVVFVGRIFV